MLIHELIEAPLKTILIKQPPLMRYGNNPLSKQWQAYNSPILLRTTVVISAFEPGGTIAPS